MRISAPLSIVMSAALLVLGLSPIDHATGDTASARRSTHSAIDKLGSIKSSVSQSSDDLSSLSALLEDERRQRLRMLPFVDIAIGESKTTLAAAQQDVKACQADLRHVESSLNAAHQDMAQRVLDIDATIARERFVFIQSAGYLAVASQLHIRNQALQQHAAELDVRLRSDVTIVRINSDINTAERQLKQLRNDPASQHLVADASQIWIAAKNRLTAARRTIIEKDTDFVSARDMFRIAQQAMTRLSAKFETDVFSLPSVTQARELRDEAERTVRSWESNFAAARQATDRALTFLETSKADLDMLEHMKKDGDTQVKKIQSSIGDVRSNLDGAASSAASATSDLGGTVSALGSIDAAFAEANCKIAELERQLAATRRDLEDAKRDAAKAK